MLSKMKGIKAKKKSFEDESLLLHLIAGSHQIVKIQNRLRKRLKQFNFLQNKRNLLKKRMNTTDKGGWSMQTISNEQTKMKRHWKQMTRCWHTCISAAYKQIISAFFTSVMLTCMLPSFVAKTSLWYIICKLTYDRSHRTCNEILNCSSIGTDYDNMQLISVNMQHNYAGILHFQKTHKDQCYHVKAKHGSWWKTTRRNKTHS